MRMGVCIFQENANRTQNICYFSLLSDTSSLVGSDIYCVCWSFVSDTSSCGHIWLCRTYLAGTSVSHAEISLHREEYSPTFPRQVAAMYSFIQLGELGCRGENANVQPSKQQHNNYHPRQRPPSSTTIVVNAHPHQRPSSTTTTFINGHPHQRPPSSTTILDNEHPHQRPPSSTTVLIIDHPR